MLVLQAYFDDSGWDGKSPIFVLAGYLSFAEKWSAFAHEWRAVCEIDDPKKLPYLKMSDAYQLRKRSSVFLGWTEHQRDVRLQKFAPVINRHVEHGVGIVIPIKEYRTHFAGAFNPPALDRPYFLAFFSLATLVAKVVRQVGYKSQIELIFDRQDNESNAWLMAEFDKFMSVAPPELAGVFTVPKWQDDKKVLPLQAADMLAWHLRRYYFDEYGGRNPVSERTNPYLANILDLKHDVIEFWTEEKLSAAANVLRGVHS